MNKLNRYLPDQRFIILLNRFIVRYDESECNRKKIIEDAYLFCVGYFFKYQTDYNNPHLAGSSNIIAVLTSALLSPNFQTIPNTISLERVLYFYKFIVEYIVWNEYEVEKSFREHKLNFERTAESSKYNSLIKKRM